MVDFNNGQYLKASGLLELVTKRTDRGLRTKVATINIEGLFIFGGTPEGHEYWLDVSEAQRNYVKVSKRSR